MIHNVPFFKINIFLILGILFSSFIENQFLLNELLIGCILLLFILSLVGYRKNLSLIFPSICIFSTVFLLGFTLFQIKKGGVIPPKHNEIYLEIVDILSEKEKVKRYFAKVKSLSHPAYQEVNYNVMLTYFGKEHLSIKSLVFVSDSLQPIPKDHFPFMYDYSDYLLGKNIHFKVTTNAVEVIERGKYSSTFRDQLQGRIKTIFPSALQGISSSLLIGDKTHLQQEEYKLFQQTGNMHLLALSGMHVGIIVLILDLIFFWRKYLNIRTAQKLQLLYLPLLWFYASIAGFTPSILRAVSMFSILIIGQAFHQKVNLLNLLCFVSFCFLLYDPYLLFDIGFILSFSAVLFISVFPYWEKVRQLPYAGRTFLSIVIVSVFAQLGTISFTSYFFQYIPAYSLFSGLLSGFFTLLLMYNGLLILLFDALQLPLELLINTYDIVYFLFQKWLSIFQYFPQLPFVNISPYTAILLSITIYITLVYRKEKWLFISLMIFTFTLQFYITHLQHQPAIYLYASRTPAISIIDENKVHSFILRDSIKAQFEYETIVKKHQSFFSQKETHFINMNQNKDVMEIELNNGLIFHYSKPNFTLYKEDSTLLNINYLHLQNYPTRVYTFY
ncbi:ComEC/Rec2 family competence protein [Flammeovirga sp. SJP92]|uniref:ComEC/Rec2 family competence protein n=1 Tax=Flammeovirga sp. SJP92 TaxID=1775430 RepID=UPI0007879CE8|nr:ComEC/Rec2 family competence protein [Flammeovirga sp. SJP92]KXX68373.1 hypothetical protein AVL50_21640 [Flammeovirga sp. SJP92]